MTTYSYIVRSGNVDAANLDYVWKPTPIRGADKYGVVLLHGANVTSDWDWNGGSWPSTTKLASVLAYNGIPCIAAAMTGNHYGKDAVTGSSGTSSINKAIDYLAAQTGCSSTKAHLIGTSMGAGAALRYASLNPTRAASVTGLIPNVSLEHIYTDNPNSTVALSFTSGIASAWGLAYRAIADGVTNSTTTLTSATANFTSADIGRQVIRSYNATGGIPVNTKIQSVTNSTTVVLDKTATSSASGLAIGIADPLPMSGTSGADYIGVHAPRLASNNIPNRWYYSSGDAFIYPADVTATATAANGTAIMTSAGGGHANATIAAMDTWNGGSDFSDFVSWLKANGA